MRLGTLLSTLLAISVGCWISLQRPTHHGGSGSPADSHLIVAADLSAERAAHLAGERVWLQGDLVRLGLPEIGDDFGVADATGISRLRLHPEVAASSRVVERLLHAHRVTIAGVVEVDPRERATGSPLRISVSRPEDIILREAPPYDTIARVLAALTIALLIGHLVFRQRSAERRALEIADFTRELNRREEILKAVGYGAERFLRSDAWESNLPEALERIGRAAEVTRVSVYTITPSGDRPRAEPVAEWIEEGVLATLGEAAAADLRLVGERLPRWSDCFLRNEVVMGTTPSLPPSEKEYLETRGVRSIIAIPVQVGGTLGGLLLLSDHVNYREWPTTEREALLIAAGMIGAAIERRRAQQALADVEDRFSQMAEHIREVFFMTNAQTHEVLYLSPAYEEIWGRSRQETIDKPLAFLDAIVPEDRGLMLQDVHTFGSGSGPAERRFEYRIRRPDGAIRWIRNRSFQVYSEDGRPHRVVGVCTDITEQKVLEEELRRANRIEAMGHLAAGIAHEINTPIQYIGGNLEFLNESHGDLQVAFDAYRALLSEAEAGAVAPERVAQISAIVKATDIDFIVTETPRASAQALEGVRRVSEIVRAMREFSHPGSGKRIATDLNHAICSTTTVARNEWKYVAELVTDLDPELPMVPCLPGELNQAILNLVVNAAHAIADRQEAEGHHDLGVITISTGKVGGWVEIRVGDTGTGIPADLRQRIFDPFFTTKEVGRGTGQGLTFVHAIVVDQHGGTVTFETERGVGTTFIVRLPCGEGAIDLSEAA